MVNCAGLTSPNRFPDAFSYTTLYMDDVPGEDLLQVVTYVTYVAYTVHASYVPGPDLLQV